MATLTLEVIDELVAKAKEINSRLRVRPRTSIVLHISPELQDSLQREREELRLSHLLIPSAKPAKLCSVDVRGRCGRCAKLVSDAELCWACDSDLCDDCWEQYGRCRHSPAELRAAHERIGLRPANP